MIQSSKERSGNYMKQLDTLRAVAVMMVIVSHWATNKANFWFNGRVGVQLFFVISGFLITGILLDARRQAAQAGVPVRGVLKNFYIRRALRIFPLFYATLTVTYLLGFAAVRASIWWHIPYLSNLFFAIRGEWFAQVSPLWSLAVEEQFYLIWPFVILFSPQRFLLPLISCVIVAAPGFRLVAAFMGLNQVAIEVLPFSSFDALGLGAMLAFVQKRGAVDNGRNRKVIKSLALISLISLCAYLALNFIKIPRGYEALFASSTRTLLAPALLGVVWLAARGFRGPIGRLMEFVPFIYLGRISYGLYLLHNFVPTAIVKLFRVLDISAVDSLNPIVFFLLNFTILVGISSLSWHFFERKISNLKCLFPYVSLPSSKADPAISQRLIS